MAIIIGGHETGLLDSSFALLNRNDRTRNGDPGHGEQTFVNVSNGNLLIQNRDAFMPSRGEDFGLLRTYNARGRASDAHQHEDARWTFSSWVRLDVRNDGGTQYFEVEYGDGSFFDYQLDTATGLYVSYDGAGAFETIEDLGVSGTTEPAYILTRADQTRLTFDKQGHLLSSVDTNGVRIDYLYESDRLVQVRDDDGHIVNYVYLNGKLFQIVDETEGVLAEYRYESGRLIEVIDRHGHSTKYFYTNDGFIERIVLPSEQDADGDGLPELYDSREISFVYEEVNWRGDNKAKAKTVAQITDAEGGITTFSYDFQFSTPGQTTGVGHTIGKGKGHFKHGDPVATDDTTNTDKFFDGGTTTMVDALGNNRAFSNDAQYVDWRLANGYYASYDPNLAATDPNFQAQVDAIRNAHSLTYTYRDDGYITEVVDQQGFHTTYSFDAQQNLTAITDRNGWGATNSDSSYFRQLRAELGVVDAMDNGKLVADLTQPEIDALREAFTSHFEYDERGNLTKSTDNADNVTTFTHTSFNKLESTTTPVGNALVTSDDQIYQDKRVELGFAALVVDLSAADVDALLELHTTFLEYDANQNLVERRDPGGDITRFEYDIYGNQTRRIVLLDPTVIDPDDPANAEKVQITQFLYDVFGNNVQTIDAEGNTTQSEFDHFGNLTRFLDGNGGETLFTYDNDNRLLTATDPESHTTINTYDAVGNRISVTDANGQTVTRVYDRNNLILATLDPSMSDPLQDRVTQFAYDVVGNRTQTTDAEGRETTLIYNARRELVEVLTAEVAGADGTPQRFASTFAYDGESNRIRTTNNRGFATEILYTQNNLIRRQTDPNGHITRFDYDANNNQLQIIAGVQLPPPKRQILNFSFDEENQLVTQTDAEGNVTRFGFDAPGNRISVTDANGNATDFEYDGNNRLIREIRPEVIDPVTLVPTRYTVEHIYDANGNEIETIDENGHSTKFNFDKDDRLVMVEDANTIKTVFEYDSRHNRTSVKIGADAFVDVNGNVVVTDVTDAQVTTFVYDEFNQLIAQVDGVGNALAQSDNPLYQGLRTELGYAVLVAELTPADQQALRALYSQHFSYDRVGNQLISTDNLSRTTSFQYDALNRLTSRTDAAGKTTSFRYDGNGNRVSQTDALRRITAFAYDSVDRLTDTTDPLNVVTHRDYDDFGNLIAETRADGSAEARTTQFVYDLNNRLVSQTDPESDQQTFEYDAVGNRLRITDGRGNGTQFVYDALDRNIKIIDPLSFETRFEYDGVGNRISLIDARGGITRFEYDPGNRRVETTDAEGRITTFAYDVRGNRVEMRTAAGTTDEEITVFEYDAENNLRSVLDAEGNVTAHDYDRVYNRIATTDGNGHTSSTEYDAVDRVIRIVDAEGAVATFAYDAVDNRLSQTDALGRVTSFTYDDNDRLILQAAPDGVETHFAYDAIGNRIRITRAANTAIAATDTFTYNRDDQLIAQSDALGNTTTFAYDENHNRTTVSDPNGHVTRFTYDANNRVSKITDAVGNVVRYVYDGNGNRVQVIDGRGFATTTYYNGNNEVSISVDAEGFATTFQYDNNGNVVSQTLHALPLLLPLDPNVLPVVVTDSRDQTTSFEYDKLNRVTARVSGEGFRTEFTYDAVGNRLTTSQFRDLAGADIATTHSYFDDVNREVAMLTAEGYLMTFQYDAVGNRTQSAVFDQRVAVPPAGMLPAPNAGDPGRITTMTYDANDRLIRESSPLGVNTDFEYDARGNRTATVDAAGSGDARRTEFTFDAADRLTDTTNALGIVTHLELDADGNVTERHDAFGTSDVRITRFEYDGNHRVIREIDALGVITATAYDASGNMVSRTGAVGLLEQRIETFEYDGNSRRVAEVNGEGERVQMEYDGAGNRVRMTLAPGLREERINTFEYDLDNRLVAGVDGVAVRTEYRYDGAGNKIETIQAVALSGQERHTSYIHDLDNRLVQITDPMRGVTEYVYDVVGNQTRIVNANGGVQENTFDAIGQLVSSLSAGGVLTVNSYDLRGNILSTNQSFSDSSDARTTTYAYDLLDRQTLITDGEDFSTSIDYDAFGNQIQITHGQYLLNPGDTGYDPDKAARASVQGNSFIYDARDRMLSSTDGEGNVTTYTYDAAGNRLSMTEASNSAPRTTTFKYDLANRATETVTPEGGITRSSYNKVGDRIAEDILQSDDGVTQIWIHREFEYDGNARLIAEIDPFGVRTESAYDAMGNETLTRFAAGTLDERVVRFEYDLNNRKTADIDGEGNRTEYVSDAMGNRIRLTDSLGRVARYYFDASNRLVAVLDPGSFVNTFAYDSAGNQIEATVFMNAYAGPVDDFVPPAPSPSAQDRITAFQFDRASREVVRVASDGSRTENTYDAAGNLIEEKRFANAAAPRNLSYSYDLNNRLIQSTDVDGTVTTFTYDGANNRTSERISNASDPNAVRETTFEYDLNNRRIRETFDPGGLNIVQTFVFDKIGNAVSKTDGNGATDTFSYDLNNRITSRTDPLGNTLSFSYDAVGNQIAVTDPRGNTTDFEYDKNNRGIREIQPEVPIFTIDGGLSTQQPTIVHLYDAAGNEIQTVDANGNTTTRYFDGSDRMVAMITGDNVLVEMAYNAAGEEVSKTLYMTRLPDSAHDPLVRPAPPAGNLRITHTEYDLAGRPTRVILPEVEITTLSNTETDNPSESRTIVSPEETVVYDVFGNAVENTDRNGNRTVNYYDAKGRVVASVDPKGFLVETDFDAQDNILEQRTYTQALDPSTVSPNVRPTPPAGEVYQINRSYDAASRLIEEKSALVDVFDPATLTTAPERIVSTFTYDSVGNRLTRTIAAGTPQAITEYSYYDALGREVALINANRVLHLSQYDGNGNLTMQKRLFNPVPISVDLTTLTGATDFAALVAADENDQIIQRVYDAGNRQSSETELMGPGAGDDLTRSFRYNAGNERTWVQNENGFVTQNAFDAAGRIVRTISADGSGSISEYDAAGNTLFVYTGDIVSQAVPANVSSATLADAISISWDLPAGTRAQSRVVFDTVSRANIDDYVDRTAIQGTWFSPNASAEVPIAGLNAGDSVFFRVVSQDIAGNLAWTGERSVTIPPRFSNVAVAQPSSTSLEVTLDFEPGVVDPELRYGMPSSTTNSATLVDLGGGMYKASLAGVTNPQELVYRIVWKDSAGNSYSSIEIPFEATGDHVGVSTKLGEVSINGGGGTVYKVNVDTKVPSSFASDLLVLTTEWNQVGGTAGTGGTSAAGVDSTSGFHTFSMVMGEETPLEAGTYDIVLRAVTVNGEERILDSFQITLGGAPVSGVQQSLSWALPRNADGQPVGNSQLVIIDGVLVESTRDNGEGRLLVDPDLMTVGTVGHDVLYGQLTGQMHDVTVDQNQVTTPIDVNPDEAIVEIKHRVDGYDLNVSATNVPAGTKVAWRPAGSGIEFSNEVAVGTPFSVIPPENPPQDFDLKIFYIDSGGNEVIVDWARVSISGPDIGTLLDAPGTSTQIRAESTESLTVLARETEGTVELKADESFVVDPGLYTGPLSDEGLLDDLSLTINLVAGNPGGTRDVDGRDTGYFTESRYNALNAKIATNEETGIWREFGVDANGNILATYSYGKEGAPDPVITYSTFDARNLESARFDAPVPVHGETGLQRPVTRFEYDVSDNEVRRIDPAGAESRREYNALGGTTREINALGQATVFGYDRLGNQVAETDPLGNTQRKFYDAVGRLIKEIDGAGNETSFSYDVFDRRVAVTNPLGQSLSMAYDQRDRLVEAVDRLGGVTRYTYDGTDNRTSTTDVNGHVFGTEYDALGRVSNAISTQNGVEVNERRQYDAYGNLISETDGEGRVRSHIYGGFGRQLEEVDEGGRRIIFNLDRFGQVIGESSPNSGKNIKKTYDAAGRLLTVTDAATGVTTTYTYDVTGRRKSEVVTTPGDAHNRSVSYDYDALGQMTRWADSVTGMQLSYQWDAAGNLRRAQTDVDYDPDGKNTSGDPNFRFVDHVYSYDSVNRVSQIDQGTALISGFGYDAAGNRITWNNQGVVVTYQYDANARVTRGDWNDGNARHQTWGYDAVGNVLDYRTFKDGVQESFKTSFYFENNRNYFTDDDGQQTTQTLDRSGRVVRTVLVDGGSTFYFDPVYFADGREQFIRAYGKASGNSTFVYDANDKIVSLNKGQGDTQNRPEFLNFVYNNDGQILYRFHDTGKGGESPTNTEFAYANTHPVGETGNTVSGESKTLLDSGRYNLVENLGADFPDPSVTFVTASEGDTLQSIASAVYGNPSLWFLLAEANNLEPGQEIKEGTRLQVPNTAKTGRLTADTHVLYNESDIIGSTLPNLKSPPPKKKGCGSILAIIIVVVIAIVAVAVTAGLAGAFVGAGAGGITSATVASASFLGLTGATAVVAAFAVAGLIVGAVASIIQQGLFIALGYQDKFSWKDVAAGAVSGAFSGAAQGLGAVARVGAIAAESIKYAQVGTGALELAAAASKQLISNGKITSWTSLASAAVGGFIKTGSEFQQGIIDRANEKAVTTVAAAREAATEGAFSTAAEIAAQAAISEAGTSAKKAFEALSRLQTLQTTVNYITPWVQLAETAIRNDGELSPADWASAVGSTLSQLVTTETGNSLSARLQNSAQRTAVNLVVAGVLNTYDKDAARSYFENAVGNEIGQFIGQNLAATINSNFFVTQPSPRPEIQFDGKKGIFVDSSGNPVSLPDATPPPLAPLGLTGNGGLTAVPLLFDAGENSGKTATFSTSEIRQGDSFWSVARSQLGAGATNAEIQQQAQILMELNPGLDPRALQIGQLINIVEPGSGLGVSAETLARFNKSDGEYQAFLATEQELEIKTERALNGLGDPRTVASSEVRQGRDIVQVVNDPTVNRLTDLRKDFRLLQVSDDVYNAVSDPNKLPNNVERLTNDELRGFGINPELLGDPEGRFFAAIYRDNNTGGFIVANKGTKEGVDWLDNFKQGLGFNSQQYEQALDLASIVVEKFGNENVTFTGHSLGGGLASAQAVAFGGRAVTFNAAGLHSNTVEQFGVDPSLATNSVKAYFIEGEILSALQDNSTVGGALIGARVGGLPGAIIGGVLGSNVPEAAGTRIPLTAVSNETLEPIGFTQRVARTVDLHFTTSLISSFNFEINRLEDDLQRRQATK